MEQVRYKQRRCDDQEKIHCFLAEKRVGTLSLSDKNGKPYAVPVNYLYWNGKIYIHGLGSGKKNEMLAANSEVCFTVFEEFGTVTDSRPAKCDTAYFSVVILGKGVLVDDLNEKTQMLNLFLEKFMPGFFKNPVSQQFVEKYKSSLDNNPVSVYRIDPESLTAKENQNMFGKNE